MKAPGWFPQSFFARSLWMVLLAVLFSKALTLVYLLLNEDVLVDRQYSHGAALTLRAYWATPETERPRIAQAAGLRYESPETVPAGEYHWPYSEIFERQMKQELGEETEVRVRVQLVRPCGSWRPPWGRTGSRSRSWPIPCAGSTSGACWAGFRHRPAVHRRRLGLRPAAQPTAAPPGERGARAGQGPQRALAGNRCTQRDPGRLPRLQPDGRGRRAGRPRARADVGRGLP